MTSLRATSTTLLLFTAVLIPAALLNPTGLGASGTGGSFVEVGEVLDGQCGRWAHTATLIDPALVTGQAGEQVFIAGGTRSGCPTDTGKTNSTVIYDVVTRSLSNGASLNVARASHTATQLDNGRILIVGGDDVSGAVLDVAEIYDPVDGSLRLLENRMTSPRVWHTATLLEDGRVLIVGGASKPNTSAAYRLHTAEVFDPVNETFTAVVDGMFEADGITPISRIFHAAARLNDGTNRVLVSGGELDNRTAQLFDQETDSFGPPILMQNPSGRAAHDAVALGDGRVLLLGGNQSGGRDSTEIFDPATLSFLASEPMAIHRASYVTGPIATLLPGNEVLVAGGRFGWDASGDAEVFQPDGTPGQLWNAVGSLHTPRSGHVATSLVNGNVLVTGGKADSGLPATMAELFVLPDNLPPVVKNLQFDPSIAAVGAPVQVTATVDDRDTGGSNIESAQLQLDGGGWIPMISADGAFDEPVEHVAGSIGGFPSPGVHTVCVRGTDAAGNTSTPRCAQFAVYDPSAGFATGGGWVVPGGATSDDNDLLPEIDGASRATFGFVVKYKNGASTSPSGQLEFQYHVGQFNLHSATYDWLVVTNNNWAKFQGFATINGSAELYPFRVDARDGDAAGGSLADRFVIKIWAPGSDPDVDEPVYKASGDLGGGKIKIHQ